jgi:glutaryl-CoA dehydrogenase (non-decarboxylating)
VLVRERRLLVRRNALVADPELLGFELVAREMRFEGRREAELDGRVLDVLFEIRDRVARDTGMLTAVRLRIMDFELSDEQRLIQDTVRAFVDERVLPNAIENDINHHLDMSVIEGMAELGLLGIVVPEEYGGAGMDYVAEALACEEIERGEAAFRTLISVHVGLNSLALLKYATEEQKQRYLVPQARGEKLACFGLTEPAAGSDVAAMRSTATKSGDSYVLNGQKNWISYATVADHQLVFAKTDPAAKHKGISAFIVEREWPGVTTRETEHKLGIWAGSTG